MFLPDNIQFSIHLTELLKRVCNIFRFTGTKYLNGGTEKIVHATSSDLPNRKLDEGAIQITDKHYW